VGRKCLDSGPISFGQVLPPRSRHARAEAALKEKKEGCFFGLRKSSIQEKKEATFFFGLSSAPRKKRSRLLRIKKKKQASSSD